MPIRRWPIRTLVLIDGEHYPPVIAAALEDLTAAGHEILAAILIGGIEKLPEEGLAELGAVPVRTGSRPDQELATAIDELGPDTVIDLSDEPVLDYRRRHELAAVALYKEVSYRGSDFIFTPPPRPALCNRPSIAIIGTGKRTGKTAVAGYAARTLAAAGMRPVVIAMGRGGPPTPEILRGDELELTPNELIALADQGKHAASDYVEDAVLSRVPTVGCRRCGGGLAGGVDHSNVAQGVAMANEIDGDLMLLEGSGAAIPPVKADATLLIVPANIPEEYLAGYMGPYRTLIADAVMVTMCEEPFGSAPQIDSISSYIHNSFPGGVGGTQGAEKEVVRTVFRPSPTRSVEGATALVATTAPPDAADAMRRHLESLGCRVVGITHSLSNRTKLRMELGEMQGADILLCEIKAAGIDVATRWALDEGMDVVYMDNVPVGVSGDDPETSVLALADTARKRFTPSSG